MDRERDLDRETVIEMILDPASRPLEGSAGQQAFLAYLEQSPECRAMYEQQQAVWGALDLWEPTEPSASFDRGVYEKIERRPAKFWDPRAWLSWPIEALETLRPGLAAGLAALLLVAAAMVTYQPRRGDEQLAAQRVVSQQGNSQQATSQQSTGQQSTGQQATAQQQSAPQGPRIENESIEPIDQTLDDIEMLADFDALLIEPQNPGRS
jgi:hypothetical protein